MLNDLLDLLNLIEKLINIFTLIRKTLSSRSETNNKKRSKADKPRAF